MESPVLATAAAKDPSCAEDAADGHTRPRPGPRRAFVEACGTVLATAEVPSEQAESRMSGAGSTKPLASLGNSGRASEPNEALCPGPAEVTGLAGRR